MSLQSGSSFFRSKSQLCQAWRQVFVGALDAWGLQKRHVRKPLWVGLPRSSPAAGLESPLTLVQSFLVLFFQMQFPLRVFEAPSAGTFLSTFLG